MKVTANPNKKVIHYLRKKRFGSVESRDNRKTGIAMDLMSSESKTKMYIWSYKK